MGLSSRAHYRWFQVQRQPKGWSLKQLGGSWTGLLAYGGALGLVVVSLSTPTLAVALTPQGLDDYIDAYKCTDTQTARCLKTIEINACASGCTRSGYNYLDLHSQRLSLHGTLQYLKNLRNTALAYPTTSLARNGFGHTLEDMLWDQVEMFLLHLSVRYWDAHQAPLPLSAVMTGNVVDPTKFFSVTWVDEWGMAHAMDQVDLGSWLQTVAEGWAKAGRGSKIYHYLRLSERVLRPLGIRAAEGGVRNNKTGHRCYDNRYCYWFHSCPACGESYPMTVLNQYLHAVRDAMLVHTSLAVWRDQGMPGVPLPAEFNSAHIAHLKEWARGGLWQLAYAAGNHVDPTAPPNLQEFMNPQEVIDGMQRYRAYYRYDMGTGPVDINAVNNCHYHYHSLSIMADILDLITTNPYFNMDPDFSQVYYKLLYNRSIGDTRTCNNRSSIPKTARTMVGIPLAEFYMGGLLDLTFQNDCDKGQPGAFKDGTSTSSGDDLVGARQFYDAAYTNCLFVDVCTLGGPCPPGTRCCEPGQPLGSGCCLQCVPQGAACP